MLTMILIFTYTLAPACKCQTIFPKSAGLLTVSKKYLVASGIRPMVELEELRQCLSVCDGYLSEVKSKAF